jgi:hypothetical protein
MSLDGPDRLSLPPDPPHSGFGVVFLDDAPGAHTVRPDDFFWFWARQIAFTIMDPRDCNTGIFGDPDPCTDLRILFIGFFVFF